MNTPSHGHRPSSLTRVFHGAISAGELFLAPQTPFGTARAVHAVRATLLVASVQAVRHLGWAERYFKVLPAPAANLIHLLPAGTWIPIQLATAHYTACGQMGLTACETAAISREVALRTQSSFVRTEGALATGALGTPWHLLAQTHRVRERLFRGGDAAVYRLAPKEAAILVMGLPLVAIPYFRTALAAYYATLARFLAPSIRAREMKSYQREGQMALHLSWA